MAHGVGLEICLTSVDDALVADAAGANRIELNTALSLGGLTPSLGVLRVVRSAFARPIIVMIRPRPGGFCYSDGEFLTLVRDAELALENGADGLAFGILLADGSIDVKACRALLQLAEGKQLVFHRAFDVTPDPFVALEQLIDLGVTRILTSGQAPTALAGVGVLAELIRRAGGRIEILPAGGIRPENVAELVRRTGCDQVHASLRTRRVDPSVTARPHLSFGSPGSAEDTYDATDGRLVEEMRAVLDRL